MKKTRRKLPNLKTKLFGTIVAIVSVIAVMGVGVLASADGFTVSVTNSVNIAFYNLSGTVSVSAEAGADDLMAAGPKLNETTLYSAGTTTYSTISIADTAGQNLKYSGAEFLKTEGGGVTEQTKAGVVAYTFKYTPVSTEETAGSLKVMLNEEAKPSMSGASLVTAYFVSLDGNNWAEIQSKSAVVPAKDNATLYVLAVCQYLNPQGLAAKSDQTAWKFALTMWSSPESVSALTYSNALPELADGVADGIVLGEDFTPAEAEPVRMNVSGLDGSVSVSANSGANDQTETSLEETTIYSNGTNNYSSISSDETGSGNLNYTGTDFLNEVTATTENSAVVYDFAYTPEGEAQAVSYSLRNSSPILRAVASENNNVRVVINETARPRVKGATIIIGYFISTDGNLWAEIESGEAVVPVAQDSALYIRAICQYSNPEKAEFIFTKSIWNFELDISAVSTALSSLTYDNELPEVANGLSDGKALEIPEEEEFIYELSEDGQYIYFGEYPQTLKASNVTVSTTPDADGYFLGSDGERYYEYTINLDFDAMSDMGSTIDETSWSSMDQLDASTGEEMVNGGKYYFKMEKIKWRILNEVDGTYTIVADTNLQALAYQPNYTTNGNGNDTTYYVAANSAPEGTYANNYQYSELRRFLNDDFMDKAFNANQKKLIQQIEVDNIDYSTGEQVAYTTSDYVWAISESEVKTYIGENGSEEVKSWRANLETSDFSRATGAITFTKAYFMSEGGSEEDAMVYEAYFDTGYTWLRSTVYTDVNMGYFVYSILFAGFMPNGVNSAVSGVLPALQLDLSAGGDEEFVYELSEDGQYIYFGEYPQTLKASNVTVSTTPDADGYFLGSDGERYYEYTINLDFHAIGKSEATWLSWDQLDASTGEEMANGGTYYFKMEKIKWRILDETDGTYTIVADTNLQALAYQPTYTKDGSNYYTTANGAPEGTFANNYQYSELRRFLNADFMDFAFSEEQKSLIQKDVEADNSLASTGEETNSYVCENTFDDVWALSVSEITTLIGEEESDDLNSWAMDLETSDYARATGAMTCTEAYFTKIYGEEGALAREAWFGTGSTWLRSPYPSGSNYARGVGYYGFVNTVYCPYIGVLPALQLKIN